MRNIFLEKSYAKYRGEASSKMLYSFFLYILVEVNQNMLKL